jgi:hypothetical protein
VAFQKLYGFYSNCLASAKGKMNFFIFSWFYFYVIASLVYTLKLRESIHNKVYSCAQGWFPVCVVAPSTSPAPSLLG